MNEIGNWPRNDQQYEALRRDVGKVLDLTQRMPALPFSANSGHLDFCEYSDVIEGPFEPVLQALADTFSDERITVLTVDPGPSIYRSRYGTFGAFSIPGGNISETYWEAMRHQPTGELIFSADKIALIGSSLRWAVWAERSWDIGIILSDRADGPWTSCGVPFVSAGDALAKFTETYYREPLSDGERESFLRNVREKSGGKD